MKPTQEQVIAWAREARLAEPTHPFNPWGAGTEALKRLATLAYEAGSKDENEACAKYLESKDDGVWANTCAASIRARREQ